MLISELTASLAALIDQLVLNHAFPFRCVVRYGSTMLNLEDKYSQSQADLA
jgi:hypothetical protein